MIETIRRLRSLDGQVPAAYQDRAPFQVQEVEDGIAQLLQQQAETYAPQSVRHPMAPLPSYVRHADNADEIAKLTAHAVISQFEECAKAVEQMREPLKAWAEGHQNALNDLHAAMKYVEEAAQRCRDLGAGTFERFQKSASVIAEVRRTCDELCTRIEPPV